MLTVATLISVFMMSRMNQVKMVISTILLLFTLLPKSSADCMLKPYPSENDCLILVDEGYIDHSNYSFRPTICPSETRNVTLKELLHDCFKQFFRNCTPSQTLACLKNLTKSTDRELECSDQAADGPVPSIDRDMITPTSMNLMISVNHVSTGIYFNIRYCENGSSVISIAPKMLDSDHKEMSIPIKDLKPDTTYIFFVEARDKNGNFARAKITARTTTICVKNLLSRNHCTDKAETWPICSVQRGDSATALPPLLCSRFPPWAIALIVGIIVLIGLIVAGVCLCQRKYNKNSHEGYDLANKC